MLIDSANSKSLTPEGWLLIILLQFGGKISLLCCQEQGSDFPPTQLPAIEIKNEREGKNDRPGSQRQMQWAFFFLEGVGLNVLL